jgi:hypothetical protein
MRALYNQPELKLRYLIRSPSELTESKRLTSLGNHGESSKNGRKVQHGSAIFSLCFGIAE